MNGDAGFGGRIVGVAVLTLGMRSAASFAFAIPLRRVSINCANRGSRRKDSHRQIGRQFAAVHGVASLIPGTLQPDFGRRMVGPADILGRRVGNHMRQQSTGNLIRADMILSAFNRLPQLMHPRLANLR